MGGPRSITGKVNDAFARVDSVIVLWSSSAAGSSWVRAELEAAIQSGIEVGTLRIIPVCLDVTPLPALLRPVRRVDLCDEDVTQAVNGIIGFSNDRDRLKAIQETLDEAQIEVEYFYGHGAVVVCPECGAGLDHLEGWQAVDEERDDMYAAVRCRACRWEGGGEI